MATDPALSAVNIAEARAFLVSLQDAGLAPSSVAEFVHGLRAFSAWCDANGLVAERLLVVASRRDRLIIALLEMLPEHRCCRSARHPTVTS